MGTNGGCISDPPKTVSGYNEGFLRKNEVPLNPYKSWAEEQGYQVVYDEWDVYSSKIEYGKAAFSYIDERRDNYFILIGHSAGADAFIMATDFAIDAGNSDQFIGVVLLDPTFTATINGQELKLDDMANNIYANGIPVFIGDTNTDYSITIQATKVRYYPEYSHLGIAVEDDVSDDVFSYMGWR